MEKWGKPVNKYGEKNLEGKGKPVLLYNYKIHEVVCDFLLINGNVAHTSIFVVTEVYLNQLFAYNSTLMQTRACVNMLQSMASRHLVEL